VDGEIIARVERRRQWTLQEKAALLAEAVATGGRVSVVARRHGISRSLLYNWRSAWKATALVARGAAPSSAGFIQLGVVTDPSYERPAIRMASGAAPACSRGTGSTLAERAGVMEIDLPQGVRGADQPAADQAKGEKKQSSKTWMTPFAWRAPKRRYVWSR
jgi:transposase